MSNVLYLRDIDMDYQTKGLLKDFNYENELKQAENCEYYTIRPYASKAAEQAARIAGCMTLFRDPNANFVEFEDMQNAIKLAEYYLKSALYINNNMSISPFLLRVEKLRKWLIDEWEEDYISPRTVMNKAKGNFRKSKQEAVNALRVLEDHGWITRCDEPKMVDGHRAKEAWHINRG